MPRQATKVMRLAMCPHMNCSSLPARDSKLRSPRRTQDAIAIALDGKPEGAPEIPSAVPHGY
jgi:hypothetical protein